MLKRKLATAVLVSASLAAFATLGDGGKKMQKNANSTLLVCSKNFSLRSGYNYKSNNLLNTTPQREFIQLNTVAMYQKGNATYVLPLKRMILLDKVKFNPAAR